MNPPFLVERLHSHTAFAERLNTNRVRGYTLHSFRVVTYPTRVEEIIIAVFELIDLDVALTPTPAVQ